MANIESILQEDRLFQPSEEFSSKARIQSRADLDALRKKAEEDHEGFWADLAREELDWHKPFETILGTRTVAETGALLPFLQCLPHRVGEKTYEDVRLYALLLVVPDRP